MIQLTPNQNTALHDWFSPERRHFIGLHVLNTGNGTCFVDRWPEPRAVLVQIGRLWSLSGDPGVLNPADLRDRLTGLLHAPTQFKPLLKTVFPDIRGIDRVVYEQQEDPLQGLVPSGVTVRRLHLCRGKI
jgi:hypothetical protein